MANLNRRAFGGLLFLLIVMAMCFFVPAWTINYWQAWVFLAVFSASVIAITVYLIQRDPKLLERRLSIGPGAEKRRSQQVIQTFAAIAFIAVIAFPALDHRLGWSSVPPYAVVAGDVLVAVGLFVVFVVFRENTFAAAIIEVEPEQRVISTGPYALVRHPMYVGALVMLSGVPIALGSWWGLLTIAPITLVIVWRLLDEESLLARNLSGYSEYRNKVKYRLVPFIW